MSDFLGPYNEHLTGHPSADRRRGSRRDAPLPLVERGADYKEEAAKSSPHRSFEDELVIAMIGGYLVEFSQIPPSSGRGALDIAEARIVADPGGPLSVDDPVALRRVDLPLQDYSKLSIFEARLFLSYFGTEGELPFMPPVEY